MHDHFPVAADEGLIDQAFRFHAEATPHATALMYESERFTYADIAARSLRIAQQLQANGYGAGARIAILAERRPGLFAFAYDNLFHRNLVEGRPNEWQCGAGSRYLYICENGLVHYCSQQRGYPGVPIGDYTTADVKREFLTAKGCAPNCTIGCVHRISHIDHWRAPQTNTVSPGGNGVLVNIQSGN